MTPPAERITDRVVLLVISGGLILILLGILVGLFTSPRALPNWAENVLVSIATVAGLKLGDSLSTLVALSTGRQVERLGNKLAESSPASSGSKVDEMKVEADRVDVRAGP
jgi:dolichol kinase